MARLKLGIILGSTRPNRFGDKPAAWIAERAKKLPDFDVELLDLKDYPMPFFDEPAGPSHLNKQYTNDVVKKWSAKIDPCDAFIWVSPEYNHSTSAVLKNALDHLFPEWNKKPVAFVSYGSVGGGRAVEHLRGIAAELDMVTVRPAVHIPGSMVWGPDKWMPEGTDHLNGAADKMLAELIWWADALKAARK